MRSRRISPRFLAKLVASTRPISSKQKLDPIQRSSIHWGLKPRGFPVMVKRGLSVDRFGRRGRSANLSLLTCLVRLLERILHVSYPSR